MTTQRRVQADTPVRDSPEDRVGLMLPAPISVHLDALVALTEDAGDRTNRKELIASLILAAPRMGGKLAVILRRYRRATVRDALLHPEDAARLIDLPIHRPGPRRRTKR
jgi:hypothetical protein